MKRLFFGLVALALLASACGDSAGNVFSLTEGVCFDDGDGSGEVSDVPIVACGEPHDNEVFLTFDVADGDFPGMESIELTATEGCLDEFESFVGISYADSALDVLFLTPTSGSWEAGDREIVCFLYRVDEAKITDSMADAAI